MLKLFYSIFVAICLVACSSSEEYTGEFRVFYDQDFDKVLHGSGSRYLEKVLNTKYNDIPQTYVVQYEPHRKLVG